MSVNSTHLNLTRKWLAGLVVTVLLSTTFLMNPEPASSSSSSSPISIPVSVVNGEGEPILEDLDLQVCHEESGQWDCIETSTNSLASVLVTVPGTAEFVQLRAGGYPSSYSQNWLGIPINFGVLESEARIVLQDTTFVEVEITVLDDQNLDDDTQWSPVEGEWVMMSTQVGEAPYSWTMTEWALTSDNANEEGVATFYLDTKRWGPNTITASVGFDSFSSYESSSVDLVVDQETIAGSVVYVIDRQANYQIISRSTNFNLDVTVLDENGDAYGERELCLIVFKNQFRNEKREIPIVTNEDGKPIDENGVEVDLIVGSTHYDLRPHACGTIDHELGFDHQAFYEMPEGSQTAKSVTFQFKKTGIRVQAFANGAPAAYVQLGLQEQEPDHEGASHRRWAVTDQLGIAYFSSLNAGKNYELSFRASDRLGEARRFEDKVHEQLLPVSDNVITEVVNFSLVPFEDFPETPVTVSGTLKGLTYDSNGDVIKDSNGRTVKVGLANAAVNVGVNFGDNPDDYIYFPAKTDADGTFSVSGLPYGFVYMDVAAKGYRPINTEFTTSESDGITTYDQGTILLRQTVPGDLTYEGVLRDSFGAPIPDMVLTLNNPYGSGRESVDQTTDEEGRFSFTGLTKGHHWLYAHIDWEDYEWADWGFNLTSSRSNVSLVVKNKGATNSGPTPRISGQLLEYKDVDGSDSAVPIPGVCMELFPIEGGRLFIAETDESGYWSVTDLAEGEEYYISPKRCEDDDSTERVFNYTNKYERPTWNASKAIAKTEGGTLHELALKEVSQSGPGSVSGRVKDAGDYSNLSGLTVNLERANGGIANRSTITDARGEYEFTNLPAGEYYLNILGPSIGEDEYWDSWVNVDVTSEANRANILLYKKDASGGWESWLGSVSGEVLDENGDFHANAELQVYDPFSLFGNYAFTKTDNEGKFEIRDLPTDMFLFLKVIPLWSELAVLVQRFMIGDSNTEDLGTLDLNPATSISGEVLDLPQGSGVRAITVELLDSDGALVNSGQVDQSSGRYVISQVPVGTYKLRFTQNSNVAYDSEFSENSASMKPVYWNNTAYGTADINGQGTNVEVLAVSNGGPLVPVINKNVSFSGGSAIEGLVSLATQKGEIPLSGSRLIWADLWKKNQQGGWAYYSFREISAETNYRFQFVGLPAGAYKIEFTDTRSGSNALSKNFNGGFSTRDQAPEITVGDAQSVTANHTMTIAPPEKSAEAFDLDDLGAEALAQLKDEITLSPDAAPGSELDIFVGTEFAGEFVSTFANSTPVLLGDWKQVDSRGYITVTIPKTLPAGSHRIAAQDSRGVVFGWAPLSINAPDAVSANPSTNPAATKAKPAAPKGSDNSDPEEEKKETAKEEEIVAAPAATDFSSDWLFPLAGGFLMLVVAGSAWVLRSRRGRYSRK
jgi:hypothetical protein